MKYVTKTRSDGSTVTKKEGFSWPTFIILLILGIVPGLIYLIVKGSFLFARGTARTTTKVVKKAAGTSKDKDSTSK